MANVKCVVLKDFKLSVDGVNQEEVLEGESVDVPEALVEGLKKEGFLEPPAGWTAKPRPKPAAAPAAEAAAGDGKGNGDKSGKQAKA
jgi:hypothetical protein